MCGPCRRLAAAVKLPAGASCPRCPPSAVAAAIGLAAPGSEGGAKARRRALRLLRQAALLTVPVSRRAQRGELRWDALPEGAARDVAAANILLREAAELGAPEAQLALRCVSLGLTIRRP